MKRTRLVSVSCVLPAPPEVVWQKLSRVQTLHYIAAPFATFQPVVPARPIEWKQGASYHFQVRVFHVLPIGLHTIQVEIMDPRAYTMQTYEHGKATSVWNHRITLMPYAPGYCTYTDLLEVGAGFFTGLVSLWTKLFFRHRQKRWRRLLTPQKGAPTRR